MLVLNNLKVYPYRLNWLSPGRKVASHIGSAHSTVGAVCGRDGEADKLWRYLLGTDRIANELCLLSGNNMT